MTQATTMATAFARAGVSKERMRAYTLALEFIKSGGTLDEWTSVYQQAAAKLGSAGQSHCASEGQPYAARVPQPNDSAKGARTETDGGGPASFAVQGRPIIASPVRPIPLPKRGLAAISAAQQPARISLMDTLRVRDGRSIGDVWTDEYETIRATNAMEASLFRQLQRHGAPAGRVLTRDFINVETLQRMQQRAAEVADAN